MRPLAQSLAARVRLLKKRAYHSHLSSRRRLSLSIAASGPEADLAEQGERRIRRRFRPPSTFPPGYGRLLLASGPGLCRPRETAGEDLALGRRLAPVTHGAQGRGQILRCA